MDLFFRYGRRIAAAELFKCEHQQPRVLFFRHRIAQQFQQLQRGSYLLFPRGKKIHRYTVQQLHCTGLHPPAHFIQLIALIAFVQILHRALQHPLDFLRRRGLHQIIKATQADALLRVFKICVGGKHDGKALRVSLSDRANQPNPVLARHLNIGQDHVDWMDV